MFFRGLPGHPPKIRRATVAMDIRLEEGSRVGVIGGGPAGSLAAYFLLSFARRMDLNIRVDIYEPRDFTKPGPGGCNMCGGVVSESLVQMLAEEGINLPSTVVQRGIDSYVLHTDAETIRIDTPLKEKRIAAVHRGGGPRDEKELKWGGLDGYLLNLARSVGARVIPVRVRDVGWDDGRPLIRLPGTAESYDLLVGAIGVNASGWPMFEKLGLPPGGCETTRAYITELGLGDSAITRQFGSAIHMFLLDVPRLDCAAIIPKGDYLTVCLLGRDIDEELVGTFFDSVAVKRCFPLGWKPAREACRCSPKINVRETATPFVDRVVLVGDCGVTRLYKDGIGAAYRTAKAVARTAIFSGVSARDFRTHYMPVYRDIARDNRFGWLIFATVDVLKRLKPLLQGVMRMSASEQAKPGPARRMSIVLWDMFTGSAPYREIFVRTLDPRFLGGFLWKSVLASLGRWTAGERRMCMDEAVLGREYSDGDVICRQGERGDRMYVIQAGRAAVVHEEGGVEAVVGELGAGDIFGEMAIFDRQPRSATVRANGKTRVLTLDKRAFLSHVHEDPSLAYRVLEEMSQRIRSLDAEVSRLKGAVPADLGLRSASTAPSPR